MLGGFAAKVKSGLAMLMFTAADVLAPNFPSPAYDAVREWAPAARELILNMATPVSSIGAVPKVMFPS